MEIRIHQLVAGAREARGTAVVIDVFRAFSLAGYAFAAGAARMIPVGSIEFAYQLKAENPDFLLVGERHEQKPEGFDFGNSPSQLQGADLKGATIIHTTSAGTQGIANATQADRLMVASLANASATARYLKAAATQSVSLCCMGYAAQQPAEEDTLCGEYLQALLAGQEFDLAAGIANLRETSGKRFFIPEKQHFAPEIDYHLCTRPNIFDFALLVERDPIFGFVMTKVDVP